MIAQFTRLGNITEASLNDSIARFRKNVKEFREKNKIYYSRKSSDGTSDRAALVETLKAGTNNPDVKAKLDEWTADIDKMEAEEDKLRSLKAQIKELSFAKGERDMAKLRTLRDEATKTQNRISIYDKKILNIEGMESIKRRE